MPKTIAIIGAGPAGLTAGYELSKHSDCNITILEEDKQVGGISKTINHAGNRMDIGGHRFFSKSDTVMKWWQTVMPEEMLVRQRVSRIFYLRKFFDYPISLRFATFANMGLWRTLKAGFGYMWANISKRKENSLEDFYINRFGKPLYKMFFENYTEKVWGIHPAKLGADWGSQRVKGLSVAGIIKDILTKPFRKKDIAQKEVETSLIENFIYPKYGPGQLWEKVAQDISRQNKNAVVETDSSVIKINIQNAKVVSIVTKQKDGSEKIIPCDYLLSSMPVKDLVAALHGVEIPQEIKHIAETLPYRDFITVGLLVDKLLIKNQTKIRTKNNLIPDTWIYIQEPDVKIGRLQVFNNWSPYLVSDENKVWIGLEYFCNEGDDMWNMADKDFIELAANELQRTGFINKEDVSDSVRVRVKKAYPAYYGSYYDLPKIIEFLDGIENLFCIGRNGQHRYNNMDHSMLTAMEAVNNVLQDKTTKENIWSVNTEKEYHEKK